MTRRAIGLLVTLACLFVPLAADTQPPAEKLSRIGRLSTGAAPADGCGGRGPHVLWAQPTRDALPRRLLCGSAPQRHPGDRPARGAAHHIRAGHQSQDRPGARPDHPPDAPLPGDRSDPLTSVGRRALCRINRSNPYRRFADTPTAIWLVGRWLSRTGHAAPDDCESLVGS